MKDHVDQLTALYARSSKHSGYQVLTPRLRAVLPPEKIVQRSRYEEERWQFVRRWIDFREKDIIEVGGNTGFFTFGALEAGARRVTYIEGNREHAEFVELSGRVLGFDSRLTVENRYYAFADEPAHMKADVGIVLNVIHHLGDDFGDKTITIERAKEHMSHCLNALAPKVSQLVFQMGFCWKGQRTLGLFPHGLKEEMIDFVVSGAKVCWEIQAIGIPEQIDGGIVYAEPREANLKRFDNLGEFLNRPLFIMRSLCE